MKWTKADYTTKEVATKLIGPDVECVLKENDEMSFSVEIKGVFRSGNGINETMKEIETAWKTIDIDAA